MAGSVSLAEICRHCRPHHKHDGTYEELLRLEGEFSKQKDDVNEKAQDLKEQIAKTVDSLNIAPASAAFVGKHKGESISSAAHEKATSDIKDRQYRAVMTNQINFRSFDFKENLTNYFQLLQTDSSQCDVTLVSEDRKQISAHRTVLSAGSLFFRELLQHCSGYSRPMLYIRGAASAQLCSLLQFLYSGETSVQQEQVETFLQTAEDLKVVGLMRQQQIDNSQVKQEDSSEESDADTVVYSEITARTPHYEDMLSVSREAGQAGGGQYVSMEHIYTDIHREEAGQVELVEGLWSCKLCGHQEETRQEIDLHVKTSHKAAHTCLYCSKTFRNKAALKLHKHKYHTGEKLLQKSLIAMT